MMHLLFNCRENTTCETELLMSSCYWSVMLSLKLVRTQCKQLDPDSRVNLALSLCKAGAPSQTQRTVRCKIQMQGQDVCHSVCCAKLL